MSEDGFYFDFQTVSCMLTSMGIDDGYRGVTVSHFFSFCSFLFFFLFFSLFFPFASSCSSACLTLVITDGYEVLVDWVMW